MTDSSSWFFLILGLFGGLGLSYLLWWGTNHYFVPRIEFSPEVSRSKVGFYPSGIRHQIAIKNLGKRDIYNVKLRVRLKIKDILHSGGKLWDFVSIDVASEEIFILKKGSMFRVTPVAHRTASFSSALYSKNIREAHMSENLSLDHLFDEYSEIRMFVEVIGTDRFSGGTKYFRSKEFSKSDIRNGVYWKNDHLVIHKQKKPSSRKTS